MALEVSRIPGVRLVCAVFLVAVVLGLQNPGAKAEHLKSKVSKKEGQAQASSDAATTGCEDYRADFDMYAVCQKRGLPSRRSSYGGFAYRPLDHEIAAADLPPECRGFAGEPKWNGAPEVIEWVYCDNLNSGCEYYLFVQRFSSLDDLRLKDTLAAGDKVQAFVQACRQETIGGAHQLAYVGTYPISAQEFLDSLFGTQGGFRPKDAFGFDGMRRQGLALAPAPPFQLQAFLFDTSLAPIVHKLNAVVREFETFREGFMEESNELAKLEHAKNLTNAESARKSELLQKRDVVFVKTFNEAHAKGVLQNHESSNTSAADALKQALAVYPAHDAQRERFEDLEHRLRGLVKEFDGVIDSAVKTLSRPPPARELVYHPGDTLFVFLKGTGSIAPKLRMTLRLRRLADHAGTSAPAEAPFGILTRAFDDPPQLNRQQNILFANDYQRYWVSLFTQPLLVANPSSANGVLPGVVQNFAIVGKLPGDYIATIELFDETTRRSATADIEFSVVPN